MSEREGRQGGQGVVAVHGDGYSFRGVSRRCSNLFSRSPIQPRAQLPESSPGKERACVACPVDPALVRAPSHSGLRHLTTGKPDVKDRVVAF